MLAEGQLIWYLSWHLGYCNSNSIRHAQFAALHLGPLRYCKLNIIFLRDFQNNFHEMQMEGETCLFTGNVVSFVWSLLKQAIKNSPKFLYNLCILCRLKQSILGGTPMIGLAQTIGLINKVFLITGSRLSLFSSQWKLCIIVCSSLSSLQRCRHPCCDYRSE